MHQDDTNDDIALDPALPPKPGRTRLEALFAFAAERFGGNPKSYRVRYGNVLDARWRVVGTVGDLLDQMGEDWE